MTTTTWSGLGSPAASPVCSARGCTVAPDENEDDDEAAGCVAPEKHAASRVRTVASTTTPTRLSLIGPVSPNLHASRHPIAPREHRERRRPAPRTRDGPSADGEGSARADQYQPVACEC